MQTIDLFKLMNICDYELKINDIIYEYVVLIETYELASKYETWKHISEYGNLSEAFIEKYKDKLDWTYIRLWYRNDSYDLEALIEKYKNKLDWVELCKEYDNITLSFIDKFVDKINWYKLSSNQSLSYSIIDKYNDRLNWYNISYYFNTWGENDDYTIFKEFVNKYKNKIDFDRLCENSYLRNHHDLWLYIRNKYKTEIDDYHNLL